MRTPQRAFTNTEFRQMKRLQRQGKNATDLSEVFQRSTSTTSYVMRADTFEQFQEIQRKSKVYQPTKTPKPVVVPNNDIGIIGTKLDGILAMLAEHSEQLKRIPKRRKF